MVRTGHTALHFEFGDLIAFPVRITGTTGTVEGSAGTDCDTSLQLAGGCMSNDGAGGAVRAPVR